MEEKIKKLTKCVKLLSKLLIAICELRTFAVVAELTIKTIIQVWTAI